MKTLQVFHLIKTSAYQLTDFNHSTSVPVLFLLKTGTKPMIEMLPSSLHFTSRKTGIDSRMPSGSLLSLRTFYAFGARSGRAPLLQRSLSHNAHGSSTYAGSLQQSTEKSITIQRSSTSSLIHSPKRSITYYNRRYLTSSSNISKPYSSTVISTRNSYHIENGAVLQRCEQPVNIPASPETKSEISKPQEDSAEMIVLIGKNQALEAEVKRLTLKLREKERSEREFRRKILEYAAEIKVWKKKYEMQKLAATIEISEVKGNEEEISDIMEQLNNAAEKLTRLDAVKDLKLLQSEMETALKEISK
uniref:Bm10925, isoform a n=1 Tax=Brugia malayi TaxID=6279 RepID=A0A0J9Y2T2_BRUMA|nr:Bm10925, isoform a [Brugia malayi]